MAVRWPAAFGGGRCMAALVTNMDVTATMLGGGRLRPSTGDGQS